MRRDQKAVIFDWNGTLIDDARLACDATNAATSVLGVSPATFQTYQEHYSMPLQDMYLKLGCSKEAIEASLDKVFEAFGNYYSEHALKVKLRQGAQETLSDIKACGYRSAVLSNHTVKIISEFFDRFYLHTHLDAILANDCNELSDIMYNANKGQRLKKYVEKHDIRKALVVGDSPEEIEIAHYYGFLGVGISGGFCSEDRIKAAKPDFMIHSLDEMPAVVRKVFEQGLS
jgi:phosphoglycolate phosphatase